MSEKQQPGNTVLDALATLISGRWPHRSRSAEPSRASGPASGSAAASKAGAARPQVVVIVLLLLGAGMLLSLASSPTIGWLAVVVAVFGLLLLGNPARLLFAYAGWAAIMNLLLVYPRAGRLQYLDEALVLACMAAYVGLAILARRPFPDRRFRSMYLALLAIAAFSAVLNHVALLTVVNFLLSYLAFPFVLYLADAYKSEKFLKTFLVVACVLLVMNFGLNVGWRVGINPIFNEHAAAGNLLDLAHGTFGGALQVAYFSIAMVFLLLSVLRAQRRPFIRFMLYGLLAVSVVQLRMTYTNHAYIFFALAAVGYLFLTVRSPSAIMRWLAVGALAVTVTVVADQVMSAAYNIYGDVASITANLSPENMERRWKKFLISPKIELIDKIAVRALRNHPVRWFLGMGPGNGISVVGMTRVSPGAYELLIDYYATESGRAEREGHSILTSTGTGLFAVWSELGMMGASLFVALYLYALFHVLRQVRRRSYGNLLQRALAESFCVAMGLFFAASVLVDILSADPLWVPLWIWAGLVWRPLPGPDTAPEAKPTPVVALPGASGGEMPSPDGSGDGPAGGWSVDRPDPRRAARAAGIASGLYRGFSAPGDEGTGGARGEIRRPADPGRSRTK